MKLNNNAKAVEVATEHAVEKTVDVARNLQPVAKVGRLTRLVPKGVSQLVGRNSLALSQHSPTYLFAAGVAGVIGTAVLASRATLKVEELVLEPHADTVEKMKYALEREDSGYEDYTVKNYNRDMTLLYAKSSGRVIKLYGPSVILGAFTIAALTGSHRILTRRNAGLTAAYAAAEKTFAEYRDRVRAELGEDKEKEIRLNVQEIDVIEKHPDDPTKDQARKAKKASGDDPSPYRKVFGPGNPNWNDVPEYNLMFLRAQQMYFTDRLRAKGHVFLNDVYRALGFEDTLEGSICGWVLGPDTNDYVDFGVWTDRNLDKFHDFMVGNEEALVLDFNVAGPIFRKLPSNKNQN